MPILYNDEYIIIIIPTCGVHLTLYRGLQLRSGDLYTNRIFKTAINIVL
jgi:hypothetical protein